MTTLTVKIASDNPSPVRLRPFCQKCGWRKGGRDSWSGTACKCGHSEPPIQFIEQKQT